MNANLKTILVVDDDESARSLIMEVLRNDGYMVLESESGDDALHVAENFHGHLDLLVADITMDPFLSGIELCQQIRMRRPDLKVLYVSGYPKSDLIKGLLKGSPDEFLAKPFQVQELSDKVREILEGSTHVN